MRKLTGGITIDNETFAPQLALFLDGAETGVLMPMEAVQDMRATHGEDAEQHIINLVIEQLSVSHSLTENEEEYYKENFKKLVSTN